MVSRESALMILTHMGYKLPIVELQFPLLLSMLMLCYHFH